MGHIAVATALGLVAGLVAGGHPANAARRPLRWWPALAVGVVVQGLAGLLGARGGVALAAVVASYAGLLAFAGVNLRLVGMPVIVLGLTLNLTSIVVNDGMPVRPAALVHAGLVAPADLPAVDLGAKRHLATDADPLPALGDVVPVPALRQVLSFGDLILAAGLMDVVFRLLCPPRDGAGPSALTVLGRSSPPGSAGGR